MRIVIPEFSDQKALFDYLVTNKSRIIAQKCSLNITSEAFKCGLMMGGASDADVEKGMPAIGDDATKMKVKLCINTTNYMDSHRDVHLPGLWNKSLKETKNVYLLDSHKADFDNVISDEVIAYTQTISWKALGYPEYEGKTQALMFDATLEQDRNPKMFKQYRKGWVRNHSVGMRYIKVEMAINSKDYPAEKAVWDEYFPEIVNGDEAKALGYFFAVKEARFFEGSAVLRGSNDKTPVQDVQELKEEPTEGAPGVDPPAQKSAFAYLNEKLLK